MKKSYLIILILISAAIFLAFAKKTEAADDHIVINEIYPNPETGEIEWIELFNSTALDFSLDNYSVEDGTHIPKVLAGYSILAGQYLVLEKGADFSFGLNILAIFWS